MSHTENRSENLLATLSNNQRDFETWSPIPSGVGEGTQKTEYSLLSSTLVKEDGSDLVKEGGSDLVKEGGSEKTSSGVLVRERPVFIKK